MMEMAKVEKKAEELGNDLAKVASELKRVQSIKCRLKKQKFKSSYESEMVQVLKEEELLKEVRNMLQPKEKFVTEYEKEDIDALSYIEVEKAIKSIQSKICNSKYLVEDLEKNETYQNAKKIEEMLKERRKLVKPVEDGFIRKNELKAVINVIEENMEISTERILQLLKDLI